MRAMLLWSMLLVVLGAGPARALSEQDCDDDRAAMIRALGENRDKSLRQIRAALAEATDERERSGLEVMREQAWEHEERMRGMADQNWRDCLRHARATAPAAAR